MKKMTITALCLAFIAITSFCFAGTGDVENGNKLFHDPTLAGSSNTNSCGTCHQDNDLAGKGSKANLRQVINMCISRPLGGQPLGLDSQEMLDLAAYIQSLKKE